MSEQHLPLEGIVVPVLTPLDRNENVDETGLRTLLQRLIAAGVDGLFVGGTTGLGPLLPDAQWRRLMEIALSEVGQQVPLLGGTMETSTPRAVERIRILESLGYRAFVASPTFYVTLHNEREFLRHFGACRDSTAMEMIIYNIPVCTGSSIPAGTMIEMIRRGWALTIKDSSGNRAYLEEVLKGGREYGLRLLQGNRPDLTWLEAAGVAGIVPGPANAVPELFVEAWAAIRNGERDKLPQIQSRIGRIWEALVSENDWISGITYALATTGIGSERSIRPLQPASEAMRRAIDALHLGDPPANKFQRRNSSAGG
jgi:4-hydroxy-tetrahydrodipicolinate synthase